MSTKIYTGYKINTIDFLEIHDITMLLKKKMRHKADELLCDLMTISCVSELDHRIYNKQKGGNVVSKVYLEYCERDREIRKTGLRDPLFDFRPEWVFIPTPDFTLSIFYSEQKDFTKIWGKEPLIQSFGYWDNTDPPENINDKEWGERGKIWNKYLGNDAPCCCGFSFQLYGEYDGPKPPTIKEIVRKQPSFEERINSRAENFASADYILKLVGERGKKEGFEYYYQWIGEMKDKSSEVYKKYVEKKEYLSKILPERYEEKDFIGGS